MSKEPMIEFPKGLEKPLTAMLSDWLNYCTARIESGEVEAGVSRLCHIMEVCIKQIDEQSAGKRED
jgi:hypothetical protein